MTADRRLDRAALDTVLRLILERDPVALVSALNEHGLVVPMPEGGPTGGRQDALARASVLELVVPEDLGAVLRAWDKVRAEGMSRVRVHLLADPTAQVVLHFADATHLYGVYLRLVEGHSGGVSDQLPSSTTFRPRYCTVRRSEVAITVEVDDATTRVLGWTAEELLGRRSLEFIHPDDRERAIANWMEMLAAPGATRRVRYRHRHRDGHWVWLEITNHNLIHEPGYGYVLAEMMDISDEMATQEALRANEQLLRRLTESLPLGVLQVDREHRIVYRNKRLATVVGRRSGETVEEQLSTVVRADRPALAAALAAVLEHGHDRDLEVSVRRRTGLRRCSLRLRALTAASGAVTGAIVCILDVTEDAHLREQLRDQATYDSLTRCHNRAATLAALGLALEQAGRDNSGVAVIFLDLDRFKQVNDELGHAAGDELLRCVADRLRAGSREGDVVGRLGGDEFLIISPRVASAPAATGLADRFAAALRAPVLLAGRPYTPQGSIGTAWSRGGRETAESMVARADAAMYQVKHSRLTDTG